MKRRRLIFVLLVIVVALILLFGCGACCMLSRHRCSEKTDATKEQKLKELKLGKLEHPPFTANGISHEVYEFPGNGADIILLHELPGLSIEAITLANNLRKAGYNVHVPLIFGGFNDSHAALKGFGKCFNEFNCVGNGDSHFACWLRALIAERYRGRNVVVIGMCMTGSAALEVADAPGVAGVVMAQPSLPLPLTLWQRPKIGVTEDHVKLIKKAGAPILAMRYSEDCMATRERFVTLKATFGSQVEFEVVPSRGCGPKAHATLTGDYSEQAYAHLTTFLSKHAR